MATPVLTSVVKHSNEPIGRRRWWRWWWCRHRRRRHHRRRHHHHGRRQHYNHDRRRYLGRIFRVDPVGMAVLNSHRSPVRVERTRCRRSTAFFIEFPFILCNSQRLDLRSARPRSAPGAATVEARRGNHRKETNNDQSRTERKEEGEGEEEARGISIGKGEQEEERTEEKRRLMKKSSWRGCVERGNRSAGNIMTAHDCSFATSQCR